jgi:peptide/nickel transport system ATP-binding protein
MENEMSENAPENPKALLTVDGLKMYFPIRKGFTRRIVGNVRAVDDVSFSVNPGETFGLVGESGCGKTTIGRCLLRAYQPTGGTVYYETDDGKRINLTSLTENELKPYRRELRMIFQDPYSSLNPRLTVLDIVAEPYRIHSAARGKEIEERVADLLNKVGLRPEYMRRYPHAFSGGQRQRIGLARALALNPRLIICDEPVSALDVSVQAQILNLLQDLQTELGLTYIFISHDLSVVEYLADRVAVMYVGKLVEITSTEQLFASPRHPYTEALLSAVPNPRPSRKRQRIILQGDVADPANPPPGCYFHPRCQYANERCRNEAPALREIQPEHYTACHFAEELTLKGVAT